MGCEKAQGYGIARPMPASEVSDWLTNYIPNEQWIAYGNKTYNIKEKKIMLFRLATNYWFNKFENALLATPDSIGNWPIIKHTKCHHGAWIMRERNQQLFDESWLDKLDQIHNLMHQLAHDLMNKYQAGDVSVARDGLSELRIIFEKMNMVLEQFE
ncbi:MAG: hypothetical protein GQ532_02920 [Methylomarinum sp.]|nr:hypothetical protein [Methylomarinum sp.]